MNCSWAQVSRQRYSSAFTLIELVACMVIAGLLATAVSLSLGSVRHLAQGEDVVEQFRLIDRLARQHAFNFDRPVQLLFDLKDGGGSIQRLQDGQSADEGSIWYLPEGYAFTMLLLEDGEQVDRQVAISYTPRGLSPSYAVHLVGPGNLDMWLCVAGLTGQVFELDSEAQVNAIFEVLQ